MHRFHQMLKNFNAIGCSIVVQPPRYSSGSVAIPESYNHFFVSPASTQIRKTSCTVPVPVYKHFKPADVGYCTLKLGGVFPRRTLIRPGTIRETCGQSATMRFKIASSPPTRPCWRLILPNFIAIDLSRCGGSFFDLEESENPEEDFRLPSLCQPARLARISKCPGSGDAAGCPAYISGRHFAGGCKMPPGNLNGAANSARSAAASTYTSQPPCSARTLQPKKILHQDPHHLNSPARRALKRITETR